jgi:hypothetical protein
MTRIDAIDIAAAEAIAGPDAEIIEACDAFCAAGEARLSLFYGPNAIADDKARQIAETPFLAIMEELIDVAGDVDLRATSLAGMRARAKAIQLSSDGDGYSGFEQEIVTALLLDLIESYGPLV